jgi:uncharacterized protein YcfJ
MAFVRHGVVAMWAALLMSIASASSAAAPLRLEAFDIEQVPHLALGTRLNFTLFGSAGATATLRIDGVRNPLSLAEVQPGIYEVSHTIDERDRVAPDSRVVATLRRGFEAASIVLPEPLQLGASAPVAVPAAAAPAAPRIQAPAPTPAAAPQPRPACDDCAVVVSIDKVQAQDRRDPVGAVIGAVLGALLGDHVAERDGRPVARVAGALGGALIGHGIQRSQAPRTRYEAVLQRPDGATQRRRYEAVPPFRVGDIVKVGPDVQ